MNHPELSEANLFEAYLYAETNAEQPALNERKLARTLAFRHKGNFIDRRVTAHITMKEVEKWPIHKRFGIFDNGRGYAATRHVDPETGEKGTVLLSRYRELGHECINSCTPLSVARQQKRLKAVRERQQGKLLTHDGIVEFVNENSANDSTGASNSLFDTNKARLMVNSINARFVNDYRKEAKAQAKADCERRGRGFYADFDLIPYDLEVEIYNELLMEGYQRIIDDALAIYKGDEILALLFIEKEYKKKGIIPFDNSHSDDYEEEYELNPGDKGYADFHKEESLAQLDSHLPHRKKGERYTVSLEKLVADRAQFELDRNQDYLWHGETYQNDVETFSTSPSPLVALNASL